MEKYSKWRDAGTGIQPFLSPLPSHASPTIIDHSIFLLSYIVGFARFPSLCFLALLQFILVDGLGMILNVIPPVGYACTSLVGGIITRCCLLVMGYFWIPSPEIVTLRRGKGIANAKTANINPRKGDLIISNWTSYIDLIWLSYRFNPTFLLPIHAPLLPSVVAAETTGRSTGTGSASLSLPVISNINPSPLLGYLPISLLSLLLRTGSTPSSWSNTNNMVTLDQARISSPGPICVFPEGTTSNGRGILRFSEGFGKDLDVPVKGWRVWVMYFKHPPPTPHQSSATLPSPTPITHLLFSLLPSLSPRTMSIKILHPSSSPSSGDFLPSSILSLDTLKPSSTEGDISNAFHRPINVFSECVGVLMRDMGRTKVLKLGWEDKVGFLEYAEERKAVAGGKRQGSGSGRVSGKSRGTGRKKDM